MNATATLAAWNDNDVLHLEDWTPANLVDAVLDAGDWPSTPWLVQMAGKVVCVVFATNDEHATELAVDAGKFDANEIDECDEDDFPGCVWLADRLFDLPAALEVIELPNPSLSFAAAFSAK